MNPKQPSLTLLLAMHYTPHHIINQTIRLLYLDKASRNDGNCPHRQCHMWSPGGEYLTRLQYTIFLGILYIRESWDMKIWTKPMERTLRRGTLLSSISCESCDSFIAIFSVRTTYRGHIIKQTIEPRCWRKITKRIPKQRPPWWDPTLLVRFKDRSKTSSS